MIVFFFALIWIGTPVISHGTLVNNAIVISSVNPNSPAMQAGLKPGDKLVAVNQKPIKQLSDLSEVIQKSPRQVLQIQIDRNGGKLIKELTAKYSPENKKYLIGVSLMPTPKFKTPSIGNAAKQTIALPWTTIKMLVQLIKGKVKGAVMGPIGAVDMIEQTLQMPPQLVWFSIVQFFAAISISLGLFNLLPLPLPILDGGWIVILLLERIFRREFTAEQKAAAYTIGLIAVLFAFVWITFGDIMRLVKRVLGG
jgi:regulator of sigma E protease